MKDVHFIQWVILWALRFNTLRPRQDGSWMKMFGFILIFHWNLLQRVQLITYSVGENVGSHRTFSMARPKCLMGDFTNLYIIYKAHQTNAWWTMQVFRPHWTYQCRFRQAIMWNNNGSDYQRIYMSLSFNGLRACKCLWNSPLPPVTSALWSRHIKGLVFLDYFGVLTTYTALCTASSPARQHTWHNTRNSINLAPNSNTWQPTGHFYWHRFESINHS